jgi:hypothetical protein
MMPDEYAKLIEASYRQALAQAEAIIAEAARIREEAEAERAAAREARRALEADAEKIAAACFEKELGQQREALRESWARYLARQHLAAGKAAAEIADWLGLSLESIEALVEQLHRSSRDTERSIEGGAKLAYTQSGRSGTIRFESAEAQFELWWEFAGSDAVALVGIPAEEEWEAHTGLPLEKRLPVLQFIGRQVVADQLGNSGRYVIGRNTMTFKTLR